MEKGMRFQVMTAHRAAGLLLALVMLLTTAVQAAAPTVDDGAKLFSDRAVGEANQAISRIYDHTAPHKQVYVETLASLPSGKQADDLAEERFSKHNTDGVLVFIVKDPHKLAVTVGRTTQARFHDGEGVRTVMLDRFRRGDYDGGLLAGVRVLESRLVSAFPVNGSVQKSAAPVPAGAERTGRAERVERESTGSSSWLWILLLGGGGLLALLIWRLRSRTAQASNYEAPMGDQGHIYGASSASRGGMGYAGPGQPNQVVQQAPSAGGGWGRAILGGAAGALAGNWLYDRFAHGGGDNEAHAATPTDHDHDAPSPDHGDVGHTFGGHGGGDDWSDGGGDVSLGGDGGDW